MQILFPCLFINFNANLWCFYAIGKVYMMTLNEDIKLMIKSRNWHEHPFSLGCY
ncbi:hypothetical protein HanPI659440_Chr04g0154751 [Helianthus annuus]|nr:hypothetical protein HanPI659440_Chr04g0154751 [Helianthus annuus]